MSASTNPSASTVIDGSPIADILAELKATHDDIRKLDRKVDSFRAAYDHHTAQESRIHSALRDEVREIMVKVSGIEGGMKGGIAGLSHDLAEVDTRVGILENAVS